MQNLMGIVYTGSMNGTTGAINPTPSVYTWYTSPINVKGHSHIAITANPQAIYLVFNSNDEKIRDAAVAPNGTMNVAEGDSYIRFKEFSSASYYNNMQSIIVTDSDTDDVLFEWRK